VTVAAIVLAAGASTRLGSPKQLAVLGGETLLERAVQAAAEAGCAPVVVVLGASAAEILAGCSLGEAMVVINADWDEGMAASIGCGVAAVDGWVDGAVVMACDQPAVTAAHLRVLMDGDEVTASAYAGRRGVPAYFPAAVFEDLLELVGDVGARDLLRSARAVELPGGELDVDRVEDLAQVRAAFERPSR
jgi:molybdenum cofactor cytidylyltransferase